MKLLLVVPFPPRRHASHGGARWVAGLIRVLAQSHSVGLIALRGRNDRATDPEVAALCEFAVEIFRVEARSSPSSAWRERQRISMMLRRDPPWAVGFSVRELAVELERIIDSWRPDAVHFETAVMAQYASRVAARPVVVVEQDAADGSASMQRFRARVLGRADAVVAFTARDRAAIAELVPSTRVVRIPLAVDVPPEPLDAVGNGRDVLFVGNFMHPPNVEAAERLARSIFPRVAACRPDARLVLVGAGPPAALRRAAVGNVAVTGEVDDLDERLDSAAVVVAPLFSGGGMRVKTLEALAAGKAVVATSLALEGLDVVPGEHVHVAEDDASFADSVVALLDDPTGRAVLGRAARTWAERHVSWAAVAAAYDALYASVIRPAAD